MTSTRTDAEGEYDIFLSHAGPDKPWVLALAEKLEEARVASVFVDKLEIKPGDNWVIRLSDALERSRYMVLVLSEHTPNRDWVIQEWTSWQAGHGPLGRLLPVTIDEVDLPFILKSTQAIDARHRDAGQTADALFNVVGDPATLSSEDARRLVLGRDLVFTLSRVHEEQLTVILPNGESRQDTTPLEDGQPLRRCPSRILQAASRTSGGKGARGLVPARAHPRHPPVQGAIR